VVPACTLRRICRLIMEMAFLQERRYQPYDKWFARALTELEVYRSMLGDQK
jgi:hypothetical protein